MFTTQQFTPTRHSTAQEKAKFANHFKRFVESGFNKNLFYKWFYQRLSMSFGHIAHYDIHCFYDTWFSNETVQKRFIEHTLDHPCYGDPRYTYSDVEKAIIEWLQDYPVAV
jgi:hypothetical protein